MGGVGEIAVRLTIALMAFLALATGAGAQTPYVDRIEILQSGIFQADETKKMAAPGTAAGAVSDLGNIRHVRTTGSVPGQIGVRFGYRYRVIGRPNGANVALRFVTLIPSPGIRNPKTGNTVVRGEYSREKTIGGESYRDYGFDDPWEIVPGVWTLEIWQGDRKLVSQSFTVTKQ
jgi:hypothetical protein